MSSAARDSRRSGIPSRESATIPRSLDLPLAMDFEALAKRGIALVQQLSGDEWTDYNEHDPGVTILQALCYAITDLAYRTEHPIADLALGDATDRVEAARRQGIIAGNLALSGAPHTVEDYRRFLYDEITGLQNAWLLPHHEHADGRASHERDDEDGVYRVIVERIHLPGQSGGPSETAERICAAVAAQLHARRSLGEDYEAPEEIPEVCLALAGTLDIGAEESPEDIIAAVQYAVQSQLVAPPHVTPTDALLDGGTTPDVVFEGPRLSLGAVTLPTYDTHRAFPTPEEILAAIRSVPGVRRVRDLALVIDPLRSASSTVAAAPHVRLEVSPHGMGWTFAAGEGHDVSELVPSGPWIPRVKDWNAPDGVDARAATTARLQVVRDGIRCEIRPERVVSGLRHIRLRLRQVEQHSATRMREQAYAQLPSARDRSVAHYRSIQHFLPATYGVGPGGVPDLSTWWRQQETGTGLVRQEQALQLKSYLLLFEQLLADHLSQLAGVSTLFSFERAREARGLEPDPTYFTQSLSHTPAHEDDVPDIGLVLQDVLDDASDPTSRASDRRRREAMLDHLLARYGEVFDNETLARVIDGDNRHAGASLKRLARKQSFLDGLTRREGRALGRDRSIGIDYRRGALRVRSERATAGDAPPGAPLFLPEPTSIEQRIAALAGHDDALYVIEHVLLRPRVSGDTRTRLVVRTGEDTRLAYHAFRADPQEEELRAVYSHLEELALRESLGDRSHWRSEWLALRHEQLVLMELHTGMDSLTEARALVDAVAASCRGRPHEKGATVRQPSPVDRSLLSIVYLAPHSNEHEQFLERIARENTPAHLLPACVALADVSQLQRFETLYSAWIGAWREGDDAAVRAAGHAESDDVPRLWPATAAQCLAADRAAWALHEFLVAARDQTRLTWSQLRFPYTR